MISDLEYDIEIELNIYIFMNFENTKKRALNRKFGQKWP